MSPISETETAFAVDSLSEQSSFVKTEQDIDPVKNFELSFPLQRRQFPPTQSSGGVGQELDSHMACHDYIKRSRVQNNSGNSKSHLFEYPIHIQVSSEAQKKRKKHFSHIFVRLGNFGLFNNLITHTRHVIDCHCVRLLGLRPHQSWLRDSCYPGWCQVTIT